MSTAKPRRYKLLSSLPQRTATLTSRLRRLPKPAPEPMGTKRISGGGWQKFRRRWLAHHPYCVHCSTESRPVIGCEVDHIKPLWEGGLNVDSNYQTLCIPCHEAKSAEEAVRRNELKRGMDDGMGGIGGKRSSCSESPDFPKPQFFPSTSKSLRANSSGITPGGSSAKEPTAAAPTKDYRIW